jgi:hypothetical protein
MIPYKKVDDDSMKAAIGKLPATEQEKVNSRLTEVTEGSKQSALASMCIFPIIMLVGYIALGIYFKSRGGYEVKTLDGKTH